MYFSQIYRIVGFVETRKHDAAWLIRHRQCPHQPDEPPTLTT